MRNEIEVAGKGLMSTKARSSDSNARYLAENVVLAGQEPRKQAKTALAYAHLNEEGHL